MERFTVKETGTHIRHLVVVDSRTNLHGIRDWTLEQREQAEAHCARLNANWEQLDCAARSWGNNEQQ